MIYSKIRCMLQGKSSRDKHEHTIYLEAAVESWCTMLQVHARLHMKHCKASPSASYKKLVFHEKAFSCLSTRRSKDVAHALTRTGDAAEAATMKPYNF